MVLGYAKPQNALAAHVDEDDKTTALIQGTGSNYKTQATLINESGLYSLILSSKLPQAREFKRWVTSEVLPQIRRTGGYVTVTCGEKGTLRLNLKAVYITRDFSAKEFTRELTNEIVSAVNGLVEK